MSLAGPGTEPAADAKPDTAEAKPDTSEAKPQAAEAKPKAAEASLKTTEPMPEPAAEPAESKPATGSKASAEKRVTRATRSKRAAASEPGATKAPDAAPDGKRQKLTEPGVLWLWQGANTVCLGYLSRNLIDGHQGLLVKVTFILVCSR